VTIEPSIFSKVNTINLSESTFSSRLKTEEEKGKVKSKDNTKYFMINEF